MALKISPDVEQKLTHKHDVSREEVMECFANRDAVPLEDKREQHRTDPPTQWFVAETNAGRKLKICFMLKDGNVELKTAYKANQVEIDLYNDKAY